ncbi:MULTISPECIES: helix-turn-helix domain-containing protein [Pseudofrankia]|uniref:helix-turn-helix domain-containing protein n=1 Tax=Pseudofrankia TaxID=2994363 RepID=UPI000234C861|nr:MULTISPECIES: helix-turn-helix transcriptional regulator [Pseudofrankia]OHV34400.1 hypothetical protein BCD49_23995 [Pseudofrankia sp. EUN1h]
MTEPGMEPVPDPASVSTEDELRIAMLGLLGDSYDRAVERRTGLSKTTVNDLRNGRRRLTSKTLTLIVEAYDPNRREAWLLAWRRVNARPATATAGAGAGTGTGGDSDGVSAPGGRPTDTATGREAARPTPLAAPAAGRPARPERPWSVSWRMASLTVGAALVASTIAILITFFAVRGDEPATAATGPAGGLTPAATAPGLPGGGRPLGGGPPPLGGSHGAAGPVGGPGPPRADMSPPPDGATPAPGGCYSLPLQTPADVVTEPGAESAGIRFAEMRYTYYPSWHPALAVGGRLSGPVPHGWRLVAAAWADPATADSTVAHNPGDGRFYPGDELVTSDQNCFTVQPYNLGYGGYEGITTRVYAMLVEAAKVLPFVRAAGQLGGLADADLAHWDVRVLGYAVVPSRPE